MDFMAMDVAVNAVAGALKAFFADLPDPLIPYSLHPELVEAASECIFSLAVFRCSSDRDVGLLAISIGLH